MVQIKSPFPDLIPARGATGKSLHLEILRELTAGDLIRLESAPKVAVPVLKNLRAIHHRQAQLLASGKTVKEVAAIVGCTPQRITQLQIDPTFGELVAFYLDQQMILALTDSARLADKIVDLGEMAVDELSARLEDDALRGRMHVGEVRKIAEFAMDRTVAPPKIASQPVFAPAAITITFGTPIKQPILLQLEDEEGVIIQDSSPDQTSDQGSDQG